MSTKEKLIRRFRSLPRDFTFDELVRLFSFYGFKLEETGKTSGSRVEFVSGTVVFKMHKPHPGNLIKHSVLLKVYQFIYTQHYGLSEIQGLHRQH